LSEVENFTIAQKEALVQSLPQKPGAVIVLSRFDPSEGDANNQKVLDLIGAKKWIAKRRHIIDKEKFVAFNGKLYPYIKTIDLGWATNPNIDTEEKYYLTLYTQLSKGEKFKFKGDLVNWIDLNNNGIKDADEAIGSIYQDMMKRGSLFVKIGNSKTLTIYGKLTKIEFDGEREGVTSIDISQNEHIKTFT